MNTRLVNQYVLTEFENQVLGILGGNNNGSEALEEGSIFIVVSNFNLEQSKEDDFIESWDNNKL